MYIGNDLQVAESGNKIIDDISSSFNGSTTSFALTVGGYAPVPFPINTQQIYISVNGVLQEPDPSGSAGFKLLGTNIVFSSAPTSGHAFFGVILSGADYVTVGTEFPAGSATSPSITFGTDSDTGMYSVTSGTMGFTSNGVQTFTLDGDAFRFNDNKKLMCGTGSDLEIYHNGTDSIIDNDTGELKIYASQFTVKSNDGGETQASFVENGAVSLYHNNVVKAATTSGGINVTGTVTDDGATHDGDVTFTGAAANVVWDKSADDLIFNDNATAAFGTGSDLQIFHNGSSNWIDSVTNVALIVRAGTSDLYLQGGNVYLGTEGAGEKYIDCHADGAVEIYYDNTKRFETTSGGVTVTGNAVATSKFRGNDDVKLSLGDGEDLQIFHDGSNSYIKDAGTGRLKILTNHLDVKNAAENESIIQGIEDGAVELYYDNSKKFETNTNGCALRGTIHLVEGLLRPWAATNTDLGTDSDRWRDIYVYNDIDIKDDGQIKLGDGDDIKIYHENSSGLNWIEGTGDLKIQRTDGDIYLNPKAGEIAVKCITDGAVELYYNNAKKFETTADGITLSGWMYIPDSDGSDNMIRLGNGADLKLYHDPSDSYIQNETGVLRINNDGTDLVISTDSNIHLRTNGTEEAVKAVANGAVELYYDNAKKLETTSYGAAIIEDEFRIGTNSGTGADTLFRIGSNGTNSDTHGVIYYDGDDNYLSLLVSGESHGSGGVYIENGGKVRCGAGIKLGGTGDANLLDDYEEGTWEPVVTPATNSFGSITMHGDTGGSYTKVGNSVRIMGCVRWTACDFSASSGNMQISLPFTAASRSNGDNADTVGPTRTSTWKGSLDPSIVQTKHGNAILHVFGGDKGENTMSVNGEMSTEGAIQFSCVYRTT